MLSVELVKDDVRGFMGKLLREDFFDSFDVRSVEIVSRNRVEIDGAVENTDEESDRGKAKQSFSAWSELRPLVYEVIKLGTKPSCVKIVFSKRDPESIHPNAAALFINMVYENDGVMFTTASSQREFALNKAVDDVWDDFVKGFLLEAGIGVRDRE